MPKLFAVILPTALGIGGAVSSLIAKSDAKSKNKGLIVSAVGIGVIILMLAVNLWFKA